MSEPDKNTHASPSGEASPDPSALPCPEKARSTNRDSEFMPVDQVKQLIETVEALLSNTPIEVPNPYLSSSNTSEPFTYALEQQLPPGDTTEYNVLFANRFDTDQEALQADPEFREKALLRGFEDVLRFCERELRHRGEDRIDNGLLFHEVMSAVRRVLVQMLGRWYSLQSTGGLV